MQFFNSRNILMFFGICMKDWFRIGKDTMAAQSQHLAKYWILLKSTFSIDKITQLSKFCHSERSEESQHVESLAAS